jgi:hypothetical protein
LVVNGTPLVNRSFIVRSSDDSSGAKVQAEAEAEARRRGGGGMRVRYAALRYVLR